MTTLMLTRSELCGLGVGRVRCVRVVTISFGHCSHLILTKVFISAQDYGTEIGVIVNDAAKHSGLYKPVRWIKVAVQLKCETSIKLYALPFRV